MTDEKGKSWIKKHKDKVYILTNLVSVAVVALAINTCFVGMENDIENNRNDINDMQTEIKDIKNIQQNIDNTLVEIQARILTRNDIKECVMDKYYEWRAMIIEYLNSEPSAMGGQAEGFQMNDGHVGLITASNCSNTASGVPYNSDKLYAAINLASSISHYKLMTEFLVIRTEYASDWDNTQLIGPSITVIAIDYFEDYNNPDRLLLLSPTAAEEIGLNPIKGIMQVSVDSTNSE